MWEASGGPINGQGSSAAGGWMRRTVPLPLVSMRLKLGSHRWVTNEGYLMMKQLRRAMLVGILALGVVACGGDGETDAAPKAEGGDVEGEVLVFAAASLTDAFGDIKTAFEEDNPDAEVQLNFGGSSALREQILAGAPADVFASANESNMADVVDADRRSRLVAAKTRTSTVSWVSEPTRCTSPCCRARNSLA